MRIKINIFNWFIRLLIWLPHPIPVDSPWKFCRQRHDNVRVKNYLPHVVAISSSFTMCCHYCVKLQLWKDGQSKRSAGIASGKVKRIFSQIQWSTEHDDSQNHSVDFEKKIVWNILVCCERLVSVWHFTDHRALCRAEIWFPFWRFSDASALTLNVSTWA